MVPGLVSDEISFPGLEMVTLLLYPPMAFLCSLTEKERFLVFSALLKRTAALSD